MYLIAKQIDHVPYPPAPVCSVRNYLYLFVLAFLAPALLGARARSLANLPRKNGTPCRGTGGESTAGG